MPKRASEKRTKPYTTWVSEGVGERLERAAQRLGWTPCQLIRQAVEAQLPDVERVVDVMESASRRRKA